MIIKRASDPVLGVHSNAISYLEWWAKGEKRAAKRQELPRLWNRPGRSDLPATGEHVSFHLDVSNPGCNDDVHPLSPLSPDLPFEQTQKGKAKEEGGDDQKRRPHHERRVDVHTYPPPIWEVKSIKGAVTTEYRRSVCLIGLKGH